MTQGSKLHKGPKCKEANNSQSSSLLTLVLLLEPQALPTWGHACGVNRVLKLSCVVMNVLQSGISYTFSSMTFTTRKLPNLVLTEWPAHIAMPASRTESSVSGQKFCGCLPVLLEFTGIPPFYTNPYTMKNKPKVLKFHLSCRKSLYLSCNKAWKE